MTLAGLVWSNLWRRRARTIVTLLAVFTAYLLFSVLAATRQGFVGGIDLIGNERIMTIHKSGLIFAMPMSYRQRIASIEGVDSVAIGLWLQGYYQEPKNFVPLIAVDDDAYIQMYREILVPSAQMSAWREDRTGAIVGKTVAARNGWKLGQVVPLRSAIYRKPDGTNTWDYRIAAIYDTSNKAFDTESVMVHYEYINENRPDGAFSKDQVGWYIAKLKDPQKAPDVAKQIDTMFANSTSETKTSSEKAFLESFTGQFGNIGKIVTYVVSAVFFSMLLVTASTMAQAVRERTAELAVLKALGFGQRLVFGLVLGEALAITLLGAALGLGFGWLLCQGLAVGLTRIFPAFELRPEAVVVGAVAALLLGVVSGLWPAWRAMRMRMIDALREA